MRPRGARCGDTAASRATCSSGEGPWALRSAPAGVPAWPRVRSRSRTEGRRPREREGSEGWGDTTAEKGWGTTAVPVCGRWSRRERMGTTAVVRREWTTATPPPSTETAQPRPRDGVSHAPVAVSGRDTGPCAAPNTGKRERHRLGRQAVSGNWKVLLSFIPAGTHRQVPPDCVPATPARCSDGRHPTPVSRRRRRTPEAEWSPIGLRGAYVRAGPPGGERGGSSRMLCGERPGLPRPSGKVGLPGQPVLAGLLRAAFAVKRAGSALSPATAFCKRRMQGPL
ncbi:uncharacterized protein LOC134555562 [Prinia subflava]|uniref:uncharacterized protein LOC134555562 n=1 Tax=Prinia subflava TaxID=208062 RepID=UPI002FDFB15A